MEASVKFLMKQAYTFIGISAPIMLLSTFDILIGESSNLPEAIVGSIANAATAFLIIGVISLIAAIIQKLTRRSRQGMQINLTLYHGFIIGILIIGAIALVFNEGSIMTPPKITYLAIIFGYAGFAFQEHKKLKGDQPDKPAPPIAPRTRPAAPEKTGVGEKTPIPGRKTSIKRTQPAEEMRRRREKRETRLARRNDDQPDDEL